MWRIKHIFDGDYGCEELAPGERPKVLVTIVNNLGEEKSFSVDDDWLVEHNLDVGSEWRCVIAESEDLISFDYFLERLFELTEECCHENYLCEIFIPFLKSCCADGIKVVPVFDDRATGPNTKNDTETKKRMTTICAKKNDDEYVVPDYIFVPSEYSFKNPINPYLMVETKKPIILKDGVHYAALENFIAANKAELSSEINAFNRGYVLFTDGITWMFLMMNDNNEIVESPEYETVCLVDKFESYYKTNKIKVKHQSKQIDLSYMGLDKFSVETDPEEWNKLKTQIRKLLEEIRSKK